MIEFLYIHQFYWAIPWTILILFLFYKQKNAINWIELNTGKKNRSSLTRYNTKNYVFHFLFLYLIGILGITAAAGPVKEGMVDDISGKGKIFIIIDGSFSMIAGDTTENSVTKRKPLDRLEEAQNFAKELVDKEQEFAYGVITFSGEPVVHSVPTNDIVATKSLLQNILAHNFDSTGSDFKKVLKELLKQAYASDDPLQVILLSDGEVPPDNAQDISEELELLKRNNVVIHTVGVGTKHPGGSVNFFISFTEDQKREDLDEKESNTDISGTQKKEVNQKTVKTIETHREDALLEMISKKTGGKYLVVENKDWVKDLIPHLKNTYGNSKAKKKISGREDISHYFTIFVLIAIILDGIVLFRDTSLLKKWLRLQ